MKIVLICYIKKVEDILILVERNLLKLSLFSLFSLQILQVFFRYVLSNPLAWVDELSRYVFIFMVMLGAGLGAAKSEHFSMTYITQKIKSSKALKIFTFLSDLPVVAFTIVIIIYGTRLLHTVSTQITAALGISFTIPYSTVIIGASLLLLHTLFQWIYLMNNEYFLI
ncbi:MAG: TRAP transporter small permease [Bacteroidales bacterium]